MLNNLNTPILDFKRVDKFYTTSNNSNISSIKKVFLNCLNDAKSKALQDDKKNCLPKDLKLVKTNEKKEISKANPTKDGDILDVASNEDKFEKPENINEEMQKLIVNLLAFLSNDKTDNIEEIEEKCIQLLLELENFVLELENKYKNNVDIELNNEDVELLQTVFDNLDELNDLLIDHKNNFSKELNKELVSKIEKQVIEFEQKLEPVKNKIMTRETKNELILNVDNLEYQEELDNKNTKLHDQDTIAETNDVQVINVDGKTELSKEKLEEHQFDMEESFEEPQIINTKSEQNFDGKIDKIQRNEVEIPKDEVLKQIIDKGKAIITNDKSEVRIKLKPEILGELVLKIELEKGVVVAKALVDNYRVKELLETNMYQLKEGLEEQGVEIKTFEVQVGSNSDFEKQNRQSAFNNGKKKNVKIKQLDLEDMNLYEGNTVSYSSSIGNESTLDLMA